MIHDEHNQLWTQFTHVGYEARTVTDSLRFTLQDAMRRKGMVHCKINGQLFVFFVCSCLDSPHCNLVSTGPMYWFSNTTYLKGPFDMFQACLLEAARLCCAKVEMEGFNNDTGKDTADRGVPGSNPETANARTDQEESQGGPEGHEKGDA